MAEIIENSKNFKIIKMSLVEINNIFDSPGICDYCNKVCMSGYYIAVLHCIYCKDDYERFIKTAFNYPEDRDIETFNFETVKQKLNL